MLKPRGRERAAMIADLQKPQESRHMRSHYLYQVGMLLVCQRSSAWQFPLFLARCAVLCCAVLLSLAPAIATCADLLPNKGFDLHGMAKTSKAAPIRALPHAIVQQGLGTSQQDAHPQHLTPALHSCHAALCH